MKLLFTKHLKPSLISELEKDFLVDIINVIEIKPIDFPAVDISDKALIFTSINAVISFFNHSTSKNLSPNQKIFCVGLQSENFLNSKGFKVVKTEKNAEDLSQFIISNFKQEQFVHFCGNLALETIDKALAEYNINYRKVTAYHTELLSPKIENDYDIVAFFSPSGVRSFVKNNTLQDKTLFSIGETTTKEINNWTDQIVITSPDNTTNDLLKLIRDYASAKH